MIRLKKMIRYIASSLFSFVVILAIVRPKFSTTTSNLFLPLAVLSALCFGYCLIGLWEKIEEKSK